jgi:hypothetical protein
VPPLSAVNLLTRLTPVIIGLVIFHQAAQNSIEFPVRAARKAVFVAIALLVGLELLLDNAVYAIVDWSHRFGIVYPSEVIMMSLWIILVILGTLLSDQGADKRTRVEIVTVLDALVRSEMLEVTTEGALRYRYRLEVLRLWVRQNKSLRGLIERQ